MSQHCHICDEPAEYAVVDEKHPWMQYESFWIQLVCGTHIVDAVRRLESEKHTGALVRALIKLLREEPPIAQEPRTGIVL